MLCVPHLARALPARPPLKAFLKGMETMDAAPPFPWSL